MFTTTLGVTFVTNSPSTDNLSEMLKTTNGTEGGTTGVTTLLEVTSFVVWPIGQPVSCTTGISRVVMVVALVMVELERSVTTTVVSMLMQFSLFGPRFISPTGRLITCPDKLFVPTTLFVSIKNGTVSREKSLVLPISARVTTRILNTLS